MCAFGPVHGGLLLIYLSNAWRPLKRVKLGSIKRTNQWTNERLGTFFHYCKLAVTGDLVVLLGESLLVVFDVPMKDKHPEMDGFVQWGIPQIVRKLEFAMLAMLASTLRLICKKSSLKKVKMTLVLTTEFMGRVTEASVGLFSGVCLWCIGSQTGSPCFSQWLVIWWLYVFNTAPERPWCSSSRVSSF